MHMAAIITLEPSASVDSIETDLDKLKGVLNLLCNDYCGGDERGPREAFASLNAAIFQCLNVCQDLVSNIEKNFASLIVAGVTVPLQDAA
jgi:hypothetical protein